MKQMYRDLKKLLTVILVGMMLFTTIRVNPTIITAEETEDEAVVETVENIENSDAEQLETSDDYVVPSPVVTTETEEVVGEVEKTEDQADVSIEETADDKQEEEIVTNEVSEETQVVDNSEADSIEEEVAMPAQNFSGAANAVRVAVNAPEGAFPAGTTMKVTPVNNAVARELAESVTSEEKEVATAIAIDIAFFDAEGNEIEPLKPITVSLSKDMKGEEFGVYHVEDNGDVNLVSEDATSKGATFTSDSFSIYLIVGTTGTQPGEEENTIIINIRHITTDGIAIFDNASEEIAKNANGTYTFSYDVPQAEGKSPKLSDSTDPAFVLSADGSKIDATITGSDLAYYVTIVYENDKADYTVIKSFEQLSGDPTTESYTAVGEIGYLTDTTAYQTEVEGYVLQEVDEQVVEASGTVVNLEYKLKTYTVTYDTNGGSYIKALTGKHGEEVNVYEMISSAPELTCGQEEHTHSEPSGNPLYYGQTSGCYVARGSFLGGHYWQLNCGKSEHSHTDTCYTSTTTYSPIPTKQGYTFAGWYADKECTIKADESVVLSGNVTVYAKWEAATAVYTIVYQKENLDGTYSYYNSKTLTGTVGETAVADNGSVPTYYEVGNKTNAVINPNGSTVVYTNYDLIEYTLFFNISDSNNRITTELTMDGTTYSESSNTSEMYSITFKYGQDISEQWPTTDKFTRTSNNGTPDPFYGWKYVGDATQVSKIFEAGSEVIGSAASSSNHSRTLTASYASGSEVVLHYLIQNVDNNEYTDVEKYKQTVSTSSSTFGQKDIAGYIKNDSLNYSETVNDVKHYYFYYDRETYSIDYYYNAEKLTTKTNIRYGQNINSGDYNFEPNRPEGMEADYTFAGWFDNVLGNGSPYNFDTMPSSNLALYAKWNTPTRTVTLHFYDGVENSTITVTKGDLANVPTPEREGYVFDGWFYEDGTEFDAAAPIEEDVTIIAGWKVKTTTDYVIRYVLEDGTKIFDDEVKTSKVGKTVVAYAKEPTGTYAGYIVNAASQSLVLTGNEENDVITFVYSKFTPAQYQVWYVDEEGTVVAGNGSDDWKTAEANKILVKVDPKEIPVGYELNDEAVKELVVSGDKTKNHVEFMIKPIVYHVTYVLNGGSISGQPTEYTIKSPDLPVPQPTRTGYKFTGWDFGPEGVQDTDKPHDRMNTIIHTGSHADLVFTANWELNVFNITYKWDGAAPEGVNPPVVSESYEYGSSYTVEAEPALQLTYDTEGNVNGVWTFNGWSKTGTLTVTGHIEIVGSWTYTQLAISADGYSGTYDGAEHSVSNIAVISGDTDITSEFAITYKVDGVKYASLPKYKDVTNKEVTVVATNSTHGYEIETTASVVITPANVTVTATNKTKAYGDSDPALTASVSGLVAGESESLIRYDISRVAGENVGKYAITPTGKPVQGNYNVSYIPAELEITANTEVITITANSASKVYDGTALENNGTTYTGKLATGDTLTAVASGSITDAGKVDNVITSYQIKNAKNEDVTSNYANITTVKGSLEVTKKPVTITTKSASKVYDGTALTAGGSIEGLVTGETVSFSVTGSQTAVDSSENTYSLVWDGSAKEANYSVSATTGTLTVTEYAGEIVVTTTGGEFTYDGQAHGATVEVSTLPKGYTLETAVSNDTATNVLDGTVTADCDTLVIRNAAGEDVTAKLNIKRVDGSIKINPAPLSVTTPSATKVYDGTPLTAPGIMSGLVNGETATLNTTGSQTKVDSSRNTYTISWGTASPSNYKVTDTVGTLTVTEYADEIVVTTTGGEFTYDGKAHGATVSVSELPKGYSLETAVSNDTATHVADGTVTANCDALVIRNAAGEDVTAKLNIKRVDGTIKINPAPLTVTTESASKSYDGTPLTAGGSISGLVNSETATVKTTGTQTIKGTADNDYEIVWGTAVESDYSVSDNIGKLTVTEYAGEITVTTTGGTFTYDGKAHGATVKVEGLPTGYKVGKSASNDSATHVADGIVTADCDELSILDTNSNDVTKDLNISYVNGSITITPATLTVTTESASKVYDGTPLTAAGSMTGLVNGETAGFKTTGSRKAQGSSENTYEITWKADGNSYTAVESDYTISETLGTLTITEYANEIVVTTTGGTFTYDGKPHGATVEVSTLPTGYSVETATSNDTATHVAEGTVTADCDTLVIRNAEGEDVTAKLNIRQVTGTIKINPATLTITTNNGTKTYDGTALTAGVEVSGLVEGESVDVTATGSQTAKGSSTNTYSIVWTNATESDYTVSENLGRLTVNPATATVTADSKTKVYGAADPALTAKVTGLVNGDGESVISYSISRAEGENVGKYAITPAGDAVQGNYDVVYVPAELEITPITATIKVTADSATKVYDGTALTEAGYTYTEEVLAAGDELIAVVEGSVTDVGTADNEITSFMIVNADGKDVTKNYSSVELANGTLEVTKRPLLIKTNSAYKVYDSYPLTAKGSIEGLVDGETVTFKVTGSRVGIGSSKNTYKLVWDRTAKETNYEITEELGTLTIGEAAGPTNPPTPGPGPDPDPIPDPIPEPDPTPDPDPTEEPIEIDPTPTPEVGGDEAYWALLNLICAALSTLGAVVLLLSKSKKDEEEEEDEDEVKVMAAEEEDEPEQKKRKGIYKVLGSLSAIASIVIFILTEDITKPMVLTDRWTLLMVVLFIVSLGSLFLGRRWHEEDDDEEAEANA